MFKLWLTRTSQDLKSQKLTASSSGMQKAEGKGQQEHGDNDNSYVFICKSAQIEQAFGSFSGSHRQPVAMSIPSTYLPISIFTSSRPGRRRASSIRSGLLVIPMYQTEAVSKSIKSTFNSLSPGTTVTPWFLFAEFSFPQGQMAMCNGSLSPFRTHPFERMRQEPFQTLQLRLLCSHIVCVFGGVYLLILTIKKADR